MAIIIDFHKYKRGKENSNIRGVPKGKIGSEIDIDTEIINEEDVGYLLIDDPVHYFIDYECLSDNPEFKEHNGQVMAYEIVKTFDEFLEKVSPEYIELMKEELDLRECKVANIRIDVLEHQEVVNGVESISRIAVDVSSHEVFGALSRFETPKS